MRLHPVVPLLWLAALAGFVVMALFAAANDTFPADLWLMHRLQDVDDAAFRHTLRWTERLGDMPYLAAVWVAAAAAACVLIGRWQGLLVLASIAGRLANTGLKEIIERPRPSPDLAEVSKDQPSNFSFPSGHAEGAMILYGLVFFLAAAYIPDWRLRLAVQAVCVWVTAITGLERMYVGDHWASDVAGGYYFGALVVVPLIAFERLVIRRRDGVSYRQPVPSQRGTA